MCEHIFVFLKYMPRSRIIGLQGMHKYDFSFFFPETSKLFSKMAILFYISTKSIWGFQFLYTFSMCYYQSLGL